MRAKRWDRFDKFYSHYDGRSRFKDGRKANVLSLVDRDLGEKCRTMKTYDLCPECIGEFERFIRGGAVSAAEGWVKL